MNTASIPSCATGGFFDRFHCVATNPDHVIEGTFWAGWFGWTASDLTTALTNRQQAYALADTAADKADRVWIANKTLFLSTCSAVSSSSMVFSWAEKVGLIFPGIFGSIFGVIGYGASALTSLVRLVDSLKELNEATIAWARTNDPSIQADIAIGFCPKMVAVAFFATAAAWGAVGGVHILVGGVCLALVVDTLFKYTVITFLAYFGSIVLTGLLVNDSKNLIVQKMEAK
ncbi:MAG: hypothetical protein JSS30_07690 [Verrucomicrobia bacterium]|nr:hypothetical protein [Verrucomicrobiota bacterium]